MSSKSDEERFQALVNDFQPGLLRLCRAYEVNEECQRELLQYILLNLWRSYPSFRGECSTRSWVFRVAHNVSITHVGSAKRRRFGGQNLFQSSSAFDPSEGLNEAADLRVLRACVQKLEVQERRMML